MILFSRIFYLLNSLRLNLFCKSLKISLTARIKPKTILSKYIKIGSNTFLYGIVGGFTYIGQNCRINAKIGKFCSISNNVKIVTTIHPSHYVSTSPIFFSTSKQCGYTLAKKQEFDDNLYIDKNKSISCLIGNDVWIGENVLIKGGVKIGDGSIIGMGAVVTKDVPAYSIVAGVPAKVIKYRFDNRIIKKIIDSNWWDLPIERLSELKDSFLNVEEFLSKLEESK